MDRPELGAPATVVVLLLGAALLGVLTAVAARWLLPLLREPEDPDEPIGEDPDEPGASSGADGPTDEPTDEPGDEPGDRARSRPPAPAKIPYASLARPWFLIATGVLTTFVAVVATAVLPPDVWPPWLVLATAGALLAMIDGATTWLPNQLMHPTWVAMALAGLWTVAAGAGWQPLLRMAVGAAAWFVLFYLVWLVSRGQLGFGDVRLALLLGAGAGAAGWTQIYLCLLAGTVLGALWGVVVTARARRRHTLRRPAGSGPVAALPAAGSGFAYGPPLFLGTVLGLLLARLW